MGNVQKRTQYTPERRGELSSTVRFNLGWNTKPQDPTGKQSPCTIHSRGQGQWNGYRPNGGSVHNGKEVCKTSGTGSNQFHVNVAEPASWDRNLRNRGLNVLENFTSLKVQTASGPVGNILGETRPNNGTEDRGFTRGHRDNMERRVAEKSSIFRVGWLQGGELKEIYRLGGGKRRWTQGTAKETEREKDGRKHQPPCSEGQGDGQDHW